MSSSIPVYKIDLDVKAPDIIYLQNIVIIKSEDQLKHSFISPKKFIPMDFAFKKFYSSLLFFKFRPSKKIML